MKTKIHFTNGSSKTVELPEHIWSKYKTTRDEKIIEKYFTETYDNWLSWSKFVLR